MNIIGKRALFVSLSGLLVVASIVVVGWFGFNAGIDFVGGTLWQIRVQSDVSESDIETYLANNTEIEGVRVYKETTDQTFLVKSKEMSEDAHQQYLEVLEQEFGAIQEVRFESVGPVVGEQLRGRAIKAAILVLLAISLYIAFSFRKVSYPVKSWKYGVVTLLTLFHDVAIPSGLLALLGQFKGVEMDTNFVVALLVIMGFSVHDTIVVFDRIRENLLTQKGNTSFDDTVNESVNQTIMRSVNTSFTLVLILVAMLLAGAGSLNFFVLVILVGTLLGTYSSIFLAAPLLTLWHKWARK